MARQLLIDNFSFKLNQLNENAGAYEFKGKFAQADTPTSNKRIYPRKLWERELGKLSRKIAEGKVYGELDHPEDGKTKLQRTAVLITGLSLDENGQIIGSMKVLDTSMGKELKAIADGGGAIGVSSRGYGSVRMNEDGNNVVQDDFNLMTFDPVADPAEESAYLDTETSMTKKAAYESEEKKKLEYGFEAEDEVPKPAPAAAAPAAAPVVKKEDETPAPAAPKASPKPSQSASPKVEEEDEEEDGEKKKKKEKEDGVDADEAGIAQTKESKAKLRKEDNYWTDDEEETDKEKDEDDDEDEQEKDRKEKEKEILTSKEKKESLSKVVREALEKQQKSFETQLVVAIREAKKKVRSEVMSEMMTDPRIAGAKEAMDKVKAIMRPYVLPEDTEKTLAVKDSEVKALKDTIEGLKGSLDKSNSKLAAMTEAAKEMGFTLYLERNLSALPKKKFDRIIESVGGFSKIQTLDELKKRVAPAVQEARELVETKDHRIQKLSEQLDKKTEQVEALREELEDAIQVGLENASRVYLERQITGNPHQSEIRRKFESLERKTKGSVDKLVSDSRVQRRNENTDFSRVRSRLTAAKGGFKSDLVEEQVKETFPKQGQAEQFEVIDGHRFSMSEINKLAGVR